jgi:hypothetical protein
VILLAHGQASSLINTISHTKGEYLMNNLAYSTQQLEKVGPRIEDKLRKEIGASAPLPYEVENGHAGATTAGTFLQDVTRGLFGGHAELLYTFVFDLTQPRPAQLRANVSRQGVGCHVGTLLYSTKLSKTVRDEVTLEAPKTFGTPKFTGDAEAIEKLNAKGELLKRVDKLARTRSEIGGLTIKTDRLVKIVPQESGSLLVISSLPRPTSMGFNATLDAKEFFDMAAMIEVTL